jgi:molybdopterin synthase catalytic subunit
MAAAVTAPEWQHGAYRTQIIISHSVIVESKLRDEVSHPSCGAISSFIGVTRDNFKGRSVTHLEYTAYDSMAKKELQRICDEARRAADKSFLHAAQNGCKEEPALRHLAVAHRLGAVGIGAASVAVYASSAHRDASIWAVGFIMDELKARVPIWKKEFFVGEVGGVWKANAECGCGKRKQTEQG